MDYQEIRRQVIELLKYLMLGQEYQKSDGILGLGSIDFNVAKMCADLYLKGYGDYIIFTGNCGKGTTGVINKTEAEIFKNIAVKEGVPEDKIFLEKEATNTYENYVYSDKVIKNNNLTSNSLIVVQKPYVERRSTAIKEIFYQNRKCFITSPKMDINNFEEYYKDNEFTNIELIINEIVAEINIIELAPKYDLQSYQMIPDKVKQIYNNLVKAGYNKYLITEEKANEFKNKLKNIINM